MTGKIAVVAGMLSSVLLAGCSVFGYRGGTEQPDFSVIDRIGRVEIRHYPPRLAAQTVVQAADVETARNTGFRTLADYIFGNNRASRKIAMTAPVAQSSQKIAKTAPISAQATPQDGPPANAQATTDGWRIRFFLPGNLTLASAPRPNNDKVELASVPAADYAVLRFSNSRDEAAVDGHIATLRQALNDSAWAADGEPVAWFYDPPWTLSFLRRNEVAVPVSRNTP